MPTAQFSSLLKTYRHMMTARQMDIIESEYVQRGEAFFQVSGAGHEGTALLNLFLGENDWLHCHYRDKALMLARGVSPEMFFLCLFNKDGAHSRGRQMNAQMSAPELRLLSQVCPVGNSATQAAGVAAAIREHAGKPVVLCSLGEGMTQQGEVFEAIGHAVRDTLPVLFLIQDNGFALSTRTAGKTFFSTPTGDPSDFYSLPIQRIDGRDPLACYAAFQRIVAETRETRRPALILFNVDRLDDHSSSDDQRRYRTADELAQIQHRGDPVRHLRDWLLDHGLSEAALASMESDIDTELRMLARAAQHAPEPAPAFSAMRPLTARLSDAQAEYRGGETRGESEQKTAGELSMLEAIRETLRHRMAIDARVQLFGEDIDDPKGDVFGLTRGLSQQFPGRVANAPLAEASIVGISIGQALAGRRPVAFLQFADFLPLAYNQIQAELATLYWRTDGGWQAPVIIMIPCGGYRAGLGPFHSASMDGIAVHTPGLDVMMPSTAGDAAGLLNAAFESERPTLFFYPKNCLNDRDVFTTPDIPRHFVPLGVARTLRSGNDITMVAWGNTVGLCLRAADALACVGVVAEVIDLRCLAPLDIERIIESARRTGTLLVAHEDIQTAGLGAEIVARVVEKITTPLRIRRVARADTHVPCNFPNQLEILPSFRKILETAVAILGGEITWEATPEAGDGLQTIKAIGLSPTDESVTVVEWSISAGSTLCEGDQVALLEAEKSNFDFMSPVAGEVVDLLCAPGESVRVGAPLFTLRGSPESLRARPITRENPGKPVIRGIEPRPLPSPSICPASASTATGFVGIAGITQKTGSRQISNADIAALCPLWTADEISKRLRVETRYWVAPGETALSLAIDASRALLEKTGRGIDDIDLILCSTGTAQYASPSIAALIQCALSDGRETDTATYDISAACTGYLTGLQIAYDHLQSRPAARILLVTTEALSLKIDLGSRDTAPLFGDAASATLLVGAGHAAEASTELRRPVLSGRGEPAEALISPAGTEGFIEMDGLKVYESAVRKMPEILLRSCAEAGIGLDDLALLIPHQANQRIIDAVRTRTKLGDDRIYSNFARYGNTSSSSIPLCLTETLDSRSAGEWIGLTAFGGGFTWGGALLKKCGAAHTPGSAASAPAAVTETPQASITPAGILGIGAYLPEQILSNEELAARFNVTPDWIFERTGIRERHIAAPNQRCSDLAIEAARHALAHAGTAAEELDLIILATSTADQPSPASAARVQHALGAVRAGSLDLSAACSGFATAFKLACDLVSGGTFQKILVIGAEILSRTVCPEDRDTAILFGDGAGAVVIGRVPAGFGLIASELGTDGSLFDAVGQGMRPNPADQDDAARPNYLHMDGWQVFGFAMRVIGDSTHRITKSAGVRIEDIDLLIPHQANLRIIEAGTRRLNLPPTKAMLSLERCGNTSAASIPLALAEALEKGRLQRGHLIALIGFGGGLSWASCLIRWF